MAPASIVMRLTDQLVAGYDTYGFNSTGDFPEVVEGILGGNGDYPAGEFFLGGKIVKDMDKERRRVAEGQGGRPSSAIPASPRDRRRAGVPGRKGRDHAPTLCPGPLRRLPTLHRRLVSADRRVPDPVGRLRAGDEPRRDRDPARRRPLGHDRDPVRPAQARIALGAVAEDTARPPPDRPDDLPAAPQLPGRDLRARNARTRPRGTSTTSRPSAASSSPASGPSSPSTSQTTPRSRPRSFEPWSHRDSGQAPRYGLPFVGDNAFLIDKIEVLRRGRPRPLVLPARTRIRTTTARSRTRRG